MNTFSSHAVRLICVGVLSLVAPGQHLQWLQPNPPGLVSLNDAGCFFRAVTPDLNGDGISDILAHSPAIDNNWTGRIALFSGANGSGISSRSRRSSE